MAKSSNKRIGEEKVNKEIVCCLDCYWANLHQYGKNPVLAECRKKPNTGNVKFPYQVEVAATRWICPIYKFQHRSEKFIQPREKSAA